MSLFVGLGKIGENCVVCIGADGKTYQSLSDKTEGHPQRQQKPFPLSNRNWFLFKMPEKV